VNDTDTPPSPGPDPFGEAPPAAKVSLLEKLRGAGHSVREKYGVWFQRGPGRPRLDGDPSAGDIPLNAPVTGLPVGAASVRPGDAPPGSTGAVRRCYKALAKAFSGFADKIIFAKAVLLSNDKVFARELVTEVSMTEPEAEAFGQLVEELSRMFGAEEKYMVLGASIATVAAVGGRYVVVMRDLDKQIARKRSAQTPLVVGK